MRLSHNPWFFLMRHIHQTYGREFTISIIYLIEERLLFFWQDNDILLNWQTMCTILLIEIISDGYNWPIHPSLYILIKKRFVEFCQMITLLIIEQFLKFQVSYVITTIGNVILIIFFAMSKTLYAIFFIILSAQRYKLFSIKHQNRHIF